MGLGSVKGRDGSAPTTPFSDPGATATRDEGRADGALGPEFGDEIKVHDIAEKEKQIAILFTARTTEVEIIEKTKQNKYEIRSKRIIVAGASLRTVSAGKLAWLDDLYVLLVTSSGAEIWRVSKDKAVKIFEDK